MRGSSDPRDQAALVGLVGVFVRRFGRRPRWAARAPGRVNLIGEHTDYNDGLVLPCAIDRTTRAVAAPGADGRVRLWSESQAAASEFEVAEVCRSAPGAFAHWGDYAKGVVFALAERQVVVPGLDLAVASDVPVGAGLSSSAAFTVSLATLIGAAAGAELSPRECAEVAHRAESHYLGVGCGILDPWASALGRRDTALEIDCRSREVRPVPLPPGRVCLLVADSGVRRSLAAAASGYRSRVSECEAALAAARGWGGVPADATSLRDVPPEALPALERELEPLLLRRVRHVATENERVRRCSRALAAGDLAEAGRILRAGHQSLRDDYEVSTPELDALCEIADREPGVYGSRLTGAGFGGCTLHLVDPAAADGAAEALASGFERRFGRRPPTWQVATADGADWTTL